eukprot:CAMPEP_0114621388 /NCGR_PEP_ID=MMETSP0168-20121206/9204_1 /TAXON_ID=95228 ORGANISM="Vannella sp., Strain DIVA3 517/6/12" /NCGR_SAMPLE_ID=MMETSP0168 /ASSEMBLY_ACC=CAM_ASM_000044 /LENGTH=142 /DNA_ID=CAMNT_0001832587 /DNA_START=37 /DNA_END=465 /DNA_ORIENTATION=+
MSGESKTCLIPDELKAQFRKFKLGKNIENVAMLIKIDKDKLEVEVEDILEQVSIEELADELPAATPRFIAYSYLYTHSDGRKSFPLVFIFFCPPGINPTLNMMYASTKQRLANALQIQKIFDVRDADELSEEWLKKKLAFFT